eukprot:TRINITY_DN22555_c0_g1_i1.p1 TRINITY_DN22555_c0_g1~~TRINITY_DN22555_c0_g1_i1.p1  ORF type:complete len:214 (-),score=51.57 TRINITY_DN22555_c0_g1_i1:497-1093(-)
MSQIIFLSNRFRKSSVEYVSGMYQSVQDLLVLPGSEMQSFILPTVNNMKSVKVEVQSSRREQLEARIVAGSFSVYVLCLIQFINLMFIYTWLSLSTGFAIVVAELLLSFTPTSGVLGAWFRNRRLLEMHHMVSQLLFASPILWAMDVWDVENLPLAGYAFFAYQIMLLFYQYRAMKRILRLRRDLKTLRSIGSVVIEA